MGFWVKDDQKYQETSVAALSAAAKSLTLLQDKKLFLLDMDGTLYKGKELFPSTRGFLAWLREHGLDYMFLTNNSSKSVDAYVKSLADMGIKSTAGDFLTSVQATAGYLLEHHRERKIYVLGTASFRSELAARGLDVTDRRSGEVDCLVIGFDTELSFQKLEDACILLNQDIPYIATNPDWVCPTAYGFVPDCGCLIHNLEKACGKVPLVIGKPQPEMIYQAMERKSVAAEDTVVIGDRIYTDVMSGIRAGVDTALVLSGESTLQTVTESADKPDIVVNGIDEIWAYLKGVAK